MKGENHAWGKGETVVDTRAEEVLAWFWEYCSNERMKAIQNSDKNPRDQLAVVSPNHITYSTLKAITWPFRNRLFAFETTWVKRVDGSYVYAFKPATTEELDLMHSIQLVNAERRGYIQVTSLSKNSCKVVYVLQNDLKGSIPARITDQMIPDGLRPVFQIHERFCRDDDIDRIEREEMMARARGAQKEIYSNDENDFIER